MPGVLPPTAQASPEVIARQAAYRDTLAADLATLYPNPVSLIFEAGCGHGHLLTAYAEAHPDVHCLGVDLVSKRIERAQRKQGRLKLGNLAFRKAEATETLSVLPAHVRLAGIYVLFPDPWPKKRHQRRRLLQTELLDAMVLRAEKGCWLAVRTDDRGLFAWLTEQISSHSGWRLAPDTAWPFEHATVFQEMQGAYQSLVAVHQ